MSWLAFVVLMTKALAWPITAIGILLYLRKPLERVLPFVRELKYGDLHLTFAERVKEIAEEAISLPPTKSISVLPAGERERLSKLAAISPRSALFEAWIPVETAAVNLALRKNLGFDRKDYQSPRGLMSAMLRRGIVTPDEAAVFNDLRSLRNEAAHSTDFHVSPESIQQFVELAERLAASLETK